MKAVIYYFSGTGNSLWVARDLAGRIGAGLKPVLQAAGEGGIAPDTEIIGMVFPIVDFKASPAIDGFLNHLQEIGTTYFFAVATYGVCPGKALQQLDERLQNRGGRLSAGFAVEMPHNGLGCDTVEPEQQEELFMRWREQADEIAAVIRDRRRVPLRSYRMLSDFLLTRRFTRSVPLILRILGTVAVKGWKELAFFADRRCNSCAVCVRVCPVNNVRLENGRPVWGTECLNCFACLQWCPVEAVQAGPVTAHMRRYHHPQVAAADIMAQKQTAG